MSTSSPNYAIEDLGASLRITIPSRRRRLAILNAIAGIAVAIPLEIMIVAILISTTGQSATAGCGTSIILLALFVVVGLAMVLLGVSVLMWELDGKEIVEVSKNGIKVRRQSFSLSRRKVYLAELVTNLRSSPERLKGWPKRESIFFGDHYGLIEFDYDVKRYRFGSMVARFGSGIDEAEAEQIVAMIKQKFPQYGGT